MRREKTNRPCQRETRKEGEQMIHIGTIVSVLVTVAAVFGVIAAVFAKISGYFRNRSDRKKATQEEPKRRIDAPQPKVSDQGKSQKDPALTERAERERLTERYCETLQAIEDVKAESVYQDTFLRYARVYQVLLGLERRCQTEGMTKEEFLDEIEIEWNNSGIGRALSAQGFSIQVMPKQIDLGFYRERCRKIDEKVLSEELRKQEKLLAHQKSFLSCKDYITGTEKDLWVVSQGIASKDMKGCREAIVRIQNTLKACGCLPVFAGSKYVEESEEIRVDFKDDTPTATELPGLYIMDKDRQLVRIGFCGGTKRVSR